MAAFQADDCPCAQVFCGWTRCLFPACMKATTNAGHTASASPPVLEKIRAVADELVDLFSDPLQTEIAVKALCVVNAAVEHFADELDARPRHRKLCQFLDALVGYTLGAERLGFLASRLAITIDRKCDVRGQSEHVRVDLGEG